jgi:hypothetical protein
VQRSYELSFPHTGLLIGRAPACSWRQQQLLQKASDWPGGLADVDAPASINWPQLTALTACRYTALTITSARS